MKENLLVIGLQKSHSSRVAEELLKFENLWLCFRKVVRTYDFIHFRQYLLPGG